MGAHSRTRRGGECGTGITGENELRDTEGFVRNGVGRTKVDVSECSKSETQRCWAERSREVYDEVGNGEIGCSRSSSFIPVCVACWWEVCGDVTSSNMSDGAALKRRDRRLFASDIEKTIMREIMRDKRQRRTRMHRTYPCPGVGMTIV